jgi:hypothetical protein
MHGRGAMSLHSLASRRLSSRYVCVPLLSLETRVCRLSNVQHLPEGISPHAIVDALKVFTSRWIPVPKKYTPPTPVRKRSSAAAAAASGGAPAKKPKGPKREPKPDIDLTGDPSDDDDDDGIFNEPPAASAASGAPKKLTMDAARREVAHAPDFSFLSGVRKDMHDFAETMYFVPESRRQIQVLAQAQLPRTARADDHALGALALPHISQVSI